LWDFLPVFLRQTQKQTTNQTRARTKARTRQDEREDKPEHASSVSRKRTNPTITNEGQYALAPFSPPQ
jgi:hypothetical protein